MWFYFFWNLNKKRDCKRLCMWVIPLFLVLLTNFESQRPWSYDHIYSVFCKFRAIFWKTPQIILWFLLLAVENIPPQSKYSRPSNECQEHQFLEVFFLFFIFIFIFLFFIHQSTWYITFYIYIKIVRKNN